MTVVGDAAGRSARAHVAQDAVDTDGCPRVQVRLIDAEIDPEGRVDEFQVVLTLSEADGSIVAESVVRSAEPASAVPTVIGAAIEELVGPAYAFDRRCLEGFDEYRTASVIPLTWSVEE